MEEQHQRRGITHAQGALIIAFLIILVCGLGVLVAVTVQPAWSLKTEAGPRYADKVRDFRRALWRIASYTETGLNMAKHSELVGEASFEHNAASIELSEPDRALASWKKLEEVLAAYHEAGTAWNDSIQFQYAKEQYDRKRQAAWEKASRALVEAESELRGGR